MGGLVCYSVPRKLGLSAPALVTPQPTQVLVKSHFVRFWLLNKRFGGPPPLPVLLGTEDATAGAGFDASASKPARAEGARAADVICTIDVLA